MSRPPVPLAFGQPQLDTLWGRIQGKVSAVQEQLQHRLHHLEAGVQGQLHSMQQGLSHTAQELGHGLQGLQHGLSASAHAWTEHLHAAVDEALGPHAPQWPTQRWPAYVFLGGAMACLLISATCHLFGCCAAHISKYLWRVDYSGITILIVTSFYPPVYYGFMCQPALRNFYLASTTLMGAATIAVSLPDRFQQRAYRPLRAGMYASLGMWGVAPVLHAWLLHGHAWQMRWALLYDLAMGAMYLLGAFLYAARIPECWHPGKYDLWFHR